MAVVSQAVVKAICAGRASGAINLSGKSLDHVPSPVYDLEESMPGQGEANWWEVSGLVMMAHKHAPRDNAKAADSDPANTGVCNATCKQ